jgi:hypothetical protein
MGLVKPDIRMRFKAMGGHIHVRVFTSHDGHNFAKNGDLVFDEDEWRVVSERFRHINVEILEEDE